MHAPVTSNFFLQCVRFLLEISTIIPEKLAMQLYRLFECKGVEYGGLRGSSPLPRNFTRGLSPCGNFAELNCYNYTS